MKILILYFLTFFTTLNCQSFAFWPMEPIKNLFSNKDPEFIVKIESEYNGIKIIGAGYIVQIKDQMYVRTASHVTLGGKAKINITHEVDGDTQPITLNNFWITNSTTDDQLIGIKSDTSIKPLGIYLPNSKVYIVNPNLNFDINTLNIQNIEKMKNSAFFIVPSWSERDEFDFKIERVPLPGFIEFNNGNGLIFKNKSSYIFSDLKILPGESGSPTFSYLQFNQFYDQNELNKFIPNLNTQDRIPIIYGHVLSYMYDFNISTFLSPYRSKDLPQAINQGLKNVDLDGVEWNLNFVENKTLFNRTKSRFNENGEEEIIKEVNLIEQKAGGGTKGDGGSTTVLNIDNKFKNSQIIPGIQYNSKQIIAIAAYHDKFNYRYIFNSDWETYFSLNRNSDFKKIELINSDLQISQLIFEKIKKSGDNISQSENCLIDLNKLESNNLSLKVNDLIINDISFTKKDQQVNFPYIINAKLKANNVYVLGLDNDLEIKVDIRGLFSTDFLVLTDEFDITNYDSQLDYYDKTPYLILSLPNGKYQYLRCFGKKQY